MMTDAERCLREWAEERAGPGTTHWDGCYESHPACAARAVLRELDALRDAAREDLAFLDAVRRENARMIRVVDAALTWWRRRRPVDRDEKDLYRACAAYVATRAPTTED